MRGYSGLPMEMMGVSEGGFMVCSTLHWNMSIELQRVRAMGKLPCAIRSASRLALPCSFFEAPDLP